MPLELPPIVRLAERVTALLEEAVTRFPKRHKYLLGIDLRASAMRVYCCAYRAWRDRSQQLRRVHELSDAIDELKLRIRLSKQVGAFGSFGEFEMIARTTAELGKQCGGWLRRLHSKGQNAAAETPPSQCASILSSRDASSEANA